jgi:hypothetical protein
VFDTIQVELKDMPTEVLRNVAVSDYGLERNVVITLTRSELLDMLLSIEQENAFK